MSKAKVIEHPASKPRWQFEKQGLGYRCWNEAIETEFRFTHIKRSGETLSGELGVYTNLEGVKTNNGLMHLARFNVLSSTTRSSLSKQLASRAPGHDMDWYDGLETMCQSVIRAEQHEDEAVETGNDEEDHGSNPFLVEPFILHNQPSMIFGPGGSGKSLIALACSMSLVTGREIIPGIIPHGIDRGTGRVLYLDWETDRETVNRRINKIARGHGFPAPKILYRSSNRPFADQIEALSKIVDERDIDLLVIDSAEKAMGGSREYGDANEATMKLHESIRLIGTSALLIDHVNKIDMKSKPGTATPYGSAFKTFMVRSSWELRRVEKEFDDGVLSVAMFHAKSNDTALFEPIGINIIYSDDYLKITFDRDDVDVSRPGISSSSHDPSSSIDANASIDELLSSGRAFHIKDIASLTGLDYQPVYQRVNRGVRKGLYVKDGDGFIRKAGVSVVEQETAFGEE